MSIKIALYRKLVALGITPRVYHQTLPQNAEYPATVYDIVSDNAIGQVHDAGVHSFRRARVQIDAYAETASGADSAAEQYFDALDNFHGNLSDGLSPETVYDVRITDAGSNPDMSFQSEPTLRTISGQSRDFYILY